MKNTKTDHDLRLIFEQRTSDHGSKFGPLHAVEGHFALSTPDGLRYASAVEDINGLNLDGFEVAGQLDASRAKEGEGFYGHRLTYHIAYYVDVRKAESMVNTLKKVQRKLDALNEKLGYPESFGAYVARVALVLGVTQVGFRPADGRKTWADGEEVMWLRPGDAVGRFASIERDLQAKYQPKEQEVPSNA